MSQALRVRGPDGLARQLRLDLKKLRREIIVGAARAAVATAHQIVQNVPIAFGELRASIHVDTTRSVEGKVSVIADAPHAAAVEVGARPHVVPLEPLVEWVRLRAIQGLTSRKKPGSTTTRQSRRIAGRLQQMASEGTNSVDDVMTLAKAIQFAIAKHGTRPTWFMKKQLGFAARRMDAERQAAFERASR